MQLAFDLFGAPKPPARPVSRPVLVALPVAPAPEAPAPEPKQPSLKDRIAKLEQRERTDWGVAPFGDARVDGCFAQGGLAFGRLHEILGAQHEREWSAAAGGFAAMLARRCMREGVIVWALQRDDLYAPGLQALGIDPDRLILVRVDKDKDVLAVQEDALRTRGVTVAIGEVAHLDLTAGRRLQLVSERHGATAFALRRTLYAEPRARARNAETSAATTRWRIASAPSETNEPGLGLTRWRAQLERSRNGRSGGWILEMENAHGAEAKSDVRVVAELGDHALAARDGRAAAAARIGAGGVDRWRAAAGGH